MSEAEENSYCRLCAEPTGKMQLISPDDDVGLHSKLATKMLWINIDVSSKNTLPNSICYSCFDALERTWSFLHNVRTAQAKLNELFLKQNESENVVSNIKTETDKLNKIDENSFKDFKIGGNATGSPVNKDWEVFNDMNTEVKPEILNEELQIETVDPSTLLDMESLKAERDSDDYNPESDGVITTDSYVPMLIETVNPSTLLDMESLKAERDSDDYNPECDGIITTDSDVPLQIETVNPSTLLDMESIKAERDSDDYNPESDGVITSDSDVPLQIETVDPSTLLDMESLKAERDSDDYNPESDGVITTDSDVPLYFTTKKKKNKNKRKLKNNSDEKSDSGTNQSLTWDDYMCLCADCDTQCKNIMSLRLHSLQIHRHCCIFKCSDCGKIISNNKTFINHVRTHKKMLRYCCEFCNKCFINPTYLKSHQNNTHSDSSALTCHNCGSTFETAEQLQDHIILYTRKYKKRNIKQENLELTEDLKCEHCNKEFKSHSKLHQHKLIHKERTRDFSCHVCGKMFYTKDTLRTHMVTHEESKPFKCEFCPLTFRARGNLRSHVSLHSSAKPFVCEQCGKSFRVKSLLKSHSIIHTNLMPYQCSYCNKSFRFKTRLNLHLRQHTGAKPHKCDYCQRDFTNSSNYKKHMKRKHNIDTTRKKYNNMAGESIVKTDHDQK